MFEIVYSDGRRVWTRRGPWEELPAEDVQMIDYIQADGLRVRLAGFDTYYLAGILWGGSYEEKGLWDFDGCRYELRPGLPARLVGPVDEVPEGASVKRGRLIGDELAADLHLSVGWRDILQQRRVAHG